MSHNCIERNRFILAMT